MECIMNYQPEAKERPVIRRASVRPKCWRVVNRKQRKQERVAW